MPRRASIYAYPWDLWDEGRERALDRIEASGVTGITLAVSYHEATFLLPHNPRRKVYHGEAGALYFSPSASFSSSSPLRPLVSRSVSEADNMPRLVEAIRARGLAVTAWIVYLHNNYLPTIYPDAAVHDALDNINPGQLCPASPLVRGYATALTREVVESLGPDELHIESLGYLPFGKGARNPKLGAPTTPLCQLLLGLCFCRHCRAAAASCNIDPDAFASGAAEYLDTWLPRVPSPNDLAPLRASDIDAALDGALAAYLDARTETASSLVEEVAALARASMRVSFLGANDDAVTGIDAPRVLRKMDGLYTGARGRGRTLRRSIASLRAELPSHTQLHAILYPGVMESPKAVESRVRDLAAAGVDGLAFYNFGLLRQQQVEWIGRAREYWR